MAPLRIEVSGSSQIHHPAERVVVSISVQSEGASQEEVSRNVSVTSAQIRELLSNLSGKDDKGHALASAPVTHWSNSALSTGSFFRYAGSSKSKGRVHEASMKFEAKFQDFGKLGSVATTLSTMKFVSITNVSWRLTDKTKMNLSVQCRHQAVQDAVTKARDFAQALDRPAPPVVEIRDTGYGGSMAYGETRVMAYKSSGSPGGDFNFTPEDVSLECSITVICEDKS